MHVVEVNMEDTDDSTRLLVKEQCVFYCGDCREIFGDSLSTVSMNKGLESVSLQFVTDAVILTEECATSVSGSDVGRNIYTLDLNKIKSYHLGRCTKVNDNNEHLVVIPSPEKLIKMIVKTQSMVSALHERVEKLESLIEEVDSSEDNTEQDTKGHQKKRKIA